MREYIKIVESVMLREYFFDENAMPEDMLALNVFADMFGEDVITDDMPDWFVETYRGLAEPVKDQIEALPPIPLLPKMIDDLDGAFYDGSDAYEEGYEKELGRIYQKQLRVAKAIISQIRTIQANPEEARELVVRSLLSTIKNSEHLDKDRILRLITNLRAANMDYPELAAIERSMKAIEK